ncbi:MAG: hypothetical protein WDO74_17820 [Pseudomonadota bacterium]
MAASSRLIVHIDDLQWSDIDSLLLLEELLRPPNAPALLLLCGFREEVRLTSPILAELSEMLPALGHVHSRCESFRSISSPPRKPSELAQLSLAGGPGEPSPLARAIALESRGVPIFVAELAEWQLERQSRSDPEAAQPLGVSLEQVIQNRISELPADAGSLLPGAGGRQWSAAVWRGRAGSLGATERRAAGATARGAAGAHFSRGRPRLRRGLSRADQ